MYKRMHAHTQSHNNKGIRVRRTINASRHANEIWHNWLNLKRIILVAASPGAFPFVCVYVFTVHTYMKYLAVVGGDTVFKAILTRRFRTGISPQSQAN